MENLIKMLMDQTGLDEGMAQKAIQLIVGQLKGQLPGPVGDNLDRILKGEAPIEAEGMLKKLLGGLFGGGK